MRPDMGRVIIEDGRRGDGGPRTCYDKTTQRRGEEFENLPARESMSRHRKQNNNSQGDRLRPLQKFLLSRVGKNWNKVYSEICEVNDKRTIRGYHLRTHLFQYVSLKPDYGRMDGRPRWNEFYVDKIGVLRKTPDRMYKYHWHRTIVKKEVELINLLNGNWYNKINGLWYRFEKEIVKTTTPIWPEQIIENPDGTLGVATKTHAKEIIRKFAVGKKELKIVQQLLKEVS